MATTTIKINGMTCDHCVKRVTKEISTIPVCPLSLSILPPAPPRLTQKTISPAMP